MTSLKKISKRKLIIFAVILFGLVFAWQFAGRHIAAAKMASMGDRYFSSARHDTQKAEWWYKAAGLADPKTPNIHYQLARIYLVDGKLDLALEEIDKEIANYPEYKRSSYIRGLINGYRKDYGQAAQDFQNFIAWAPDEWGGYNDLAWVLYESEDYQKAKEAAEKGLQKFPENPWLLNGLGISQMSLGNYAEGRKNLGHALDLSQNITIADWRRAYPGNDPDDDEKSLAKFKDDIRLNLNLTLAELPAKGTYASACASSCANDHCVNSEECHYLNPICNIYDYFGVCRGFEGSITFYDCSNRVIVGEWWTMTYPPVTSTCSSDSQCCTDRTWTPDPGTVCSGTTFTQTSNCGRSRSATGTKNCPLPCTDIFWSPDPSTVCSPNNFTQYSNCATPRSATGTKNCSSACVPGSWSPDPNTVCKNLKFTQSNGCEAKQAEGTKDCSVPHAPTVTIISPTSSGTYDPEGTNFSISVQDEDDDGVFVESSVLSCSNEKHPLAGESRDRTAVAKTISASTNGLPAGVSCTWDVTVTDGSRRGNARVTFRTAAAPVCSLSCPNSVTVAPGGTDVFCSVSGGSGCDMESCSKTSDPSSILSSLSASGNSCRVTISSDASYQNKATVRAKARGVSTSQNVDIFVKRMGWIETNP